MPEAVTVKVTPSELARAPAMETSFGYAEKALVVPFEGTITSTAAKLPSFSAIPSSM